MQFCSWGKDYLVSCFLANLEKNGFLKGGPSCGETHTVEAMESRVGWTPAVGYRFPRAFMTSREGMDYFIHFLFQM